MMEEHIRIDERRFITVPKTLQKIAVQNDHNIETVTFDCPRYWDGRDMSKMRIYINYMCPDKSIGMYLAQNITIDADDSNIMHFDWTISRNATKVKGQLTFLVCVKKADEFGYSVNHWNSELNQEMYISEGLECEEPVLEAYPDVISYLLNRLDEIDGKSMGYVREHVDAYFQENPFGVDDTLTLTGLAADSKVTGNEVARLDGRINETNANHEAFVQATDTEFEETHTEHSQLVERFEGHAARHARYSEDPITPEMINAVDKSGDTMSGNLDINKLNPSISLSYANGVKGTMTYDVENKRLDIGLLDVERQINPETGEPGFILGDPIHWIPSFGAMFRIGYYEENLELGIIPQFVVDDGNGQHSCPIITTDNAEYNSIGRIATGSVTGSSTAGEDNPNSITFPFIPKLVVVTDTDRDFTSTPWSISREFFIWTTGVTRDAVTKSTNGISIYRHYSIIGNTLSWWMSDTKYSGATTGRWFAIG